MAEINLHKLLYTPCNKCLKCPYDCNQFEYIIDTRNETDTIPIPKENNKECYSELEFINV
ncbi:MAG: hypothetical protein J6M39_06760 [Lachnospiraceae bacterium]|nr:hypothetical protein [Lachnospiraceae bacterium]